MKKSNRVLAGLFITAFVFLTANYAGVKLQLNIEFIPYSFSIHSLMIMLSVIFIIVMNKHVHYALAVPRVRNMWKPFLIAIAVTIGVNILLELIYKLLGTGSTRVVAGDTVEGFALLDSMNPLQILIFVFFYASLAEEILFRGFLQNYLSPLLTGRIRLFGREISYPVIISALAFGAAHLIVIKSGASMQFVIRIVVFSTSLGLVAGYYQEKHHNNAYAVFVHMIGNLPAVIASFLLP